MSEEQQYNNCPSGIIVCSICKYGIPNNVKCIRKHELQSKIPHAISDIECRKKLVKDFESFVTKLAYSVVCAFPDTNTARNIMYTYYDNPKSYPYCTICKTFVHDKVLHASKKHLTSCSEMGTARMSKFWKCKQPKLLAAEFKFSDCDNFCDPFWKAMIAEMERQNKTFVDSENTTLQTLLREQDNIFEVTESSAPIQQISIHKNPSLWLHRTGWTRYLDGYEPLNIYEASKEFGENEDNNQLLESKLRESLVSVETYVRNIDSTHQMFFSVKCRPHCPWPSHPFTIPRHDTMLRYFSEIILIFRVIIRVNQYYNENPINDSPILKKYPPLMLTEHQREAYAKLRQQPNEQENYVDFLLSLAGQSYDDNPYECSLICAIAFMSIRKDLTYKLYDESTFTYATLLTVFKILVLYKSKKNATNTISANRLAIDYTIQYLSHPENMTSSPKVLSWVINIFSYAKASISNTPKEGRIVWTDDELAYHDKRMTIVDFRIAVMNNISSAEKLLLELCEQESFDHLPTIPWESTIDDMNNTKLNYSFLSDPSNSYRSTQILFDKRRTKLLWVDQNGALNRDTVKKFQKMAISFLEILLGLIHVTSGQPVRGTEITTLQHRNGVTSRSIFIDRGVVCIVTHYHKSIIRSNRYKTIYRFLPRSVGNLLVYYLWLILPFYQGVVGKSEGKNFRSTFLWSNDIVSLQPSNSSWDSKKLATSLRKFFATTIGITMNIADYRHIAIAIVRKYIRSSLSMLYLRKDCIENDDDADECGLDDENLWDSQAGHRTLTSISVYGRLSGEHNSSSYHIIDQYRDISHQWHTLLFHKLMNQKPRSITSLSEVLEMNRKRRLHQLRHIPLLNMLQSFIKSDATFRGNQEAVLKAIVNGKTYILQIAGTGVGKSVSFMLPAYISSAGTNIVIIPLLALQNDMEERCRQLNISCKQWKEMENFGLENLVFVTPEAASTSSFFDYVNFLLGHHLLDRIYIDECHLLLDNSHDFRPKMDKVRNVIKHASVQTILLTATLPRSRENDLFVSLGVTEDVGVYRGSTVRTNIQYHVRHETRSTYISSIKNIIDGITMGRCIIYARGIKLGAEVASVLSYDHYFAGAVKKREIFHRWLYDSNCVSVIVATSALGCGIDVPDIRCVIHVGSPFTLSEFAQESGRAGRDGSPSLSFLLHIGDFGFKIDDDMLQYIDHKRCRRCKMDEIMDGTERISCKTGEETCDLCRIPLIESTIDTFDDENFDCMLGEVPMEFNDGKRKTIDTNTELQLLDESRRRKVVRTSTILDENSSEHSYELLLYFSDVLRNNKCLVCAINLDTTCTNPMFHRSIQSRALHRAIDFDKRCKKERFPIQKYVVCFFCYVPQQWITETKCTCIHKHTMLQVIYAITMLDNSLNHIDYNRVDHMLKPIGQYGNLSVALSITKIFHDIIMTYRKNNT